MISFCLFSQDFCLSSANFSDSIWQLMRLILLCSRMTAGLSLNSRSRFINSIKFYSLATLLDSGLACGVLLTSGTRFFTYNFQAISSIILLFSPPNPCKPSRPEDDLNPFCRSKEDLIFLKTSDDFYRRTDADLSEEKESSHLCCSSKTSLLLLTRKQWNCICLKAKPTPSRRLRFTAFFIKSRLSLATIDDSLADYPLSWLVNASLFLMFGCIILPQQSAQFYVNFITTQYALFNNFYQALPTWISIIYLNPIMMNHKSIHVRCSPQEPMQLLIDKLASKSSDLYIFWQNYNQLYHAYNEKIVEIQRLAQENDMLKRERTVVKTHAPPPEESFFKERFLFMEKSCEELKNEMEKLRMENRELKKDNQKSHEEIFQLQNVLQKLKDENALQHSNIQRILNQLRNAQNQINAMTKVYEQLGQKEMILTKYVERQRELMDKIEELESEIDVKTEEEQLNRAKYEKIVKETMINAKHKVMESLPGMIQASKHKVQIINP